MALGSKLPPHRLDLLTFTVNVFVARCCASYLHFAVHSRSKGCHVPAFVQGFKSFFRVLFSLHAGVGCLLRAQRLLCLSVVPFAHGHFIHINIYIYILGNSRS